MLHDEIATDVLRQKRMLPEEVDPDTAEWTKEFEPADLMDANEDDALDVVACAGCPGESCETCAGLGFYHDANQCP